jgi:hypothetical protein
MQRPAVLATLLLPLVLILASVAFGWRPSSATDDDLFLGEDISYTDSPQHGLVFRHPNSRKFNYGLSWNAEELRVGLPLLHISLAKGGQLSISRPVDNSYRAILRRTRP